MPLLGQMSKSTFCLSILDMTGHPGSVWLLPPRFKLTRACLMFQPDIYTYFHWPFLWQSHTTCDGVAEIACSGIELNCRSSVTGRSALLRGQGALGALWGQGGSIMHQPVDRKEKILVQSPSLAAVAVNLSAGAPNFYI